MKMRTWVWRRVRIIKRKRRVSRHSVFVRNSKVQYASLKEQARVLVLQKLEKFNTFYNFNYGKITIRNQQSRWGSCSKRGSLSFNFRLMLVPEELAEYVVVHELCHLGEFNHSENFWKLVEKTLPNHKELRKKLKKIKF